MTYKKGYFIKLWAVRVILIALIALWMSTIFGFSAENGEQFILSEFCITWCASKDDVMYAATHYRNGEIPNENAIKITADFPSYKATQEQAIPKFKYYTMLIADLKKTLDEEVNPLLNN